MSSKVKDEPKSHGIIEMLKLNKPDWLVVLVGVIFSSLLGSLFPIMAVLLSEVFRVRMSRHIHLVYETCQQVTLQINYFLLLLPTRFMD